MLACVYREGLQVEQRSVEKGALQLFTMKLFTEQPGP